MKKEVKKVAVKKAPKKDSKVKEAKVYDGKELVRTFETTKGKDVKAVAESWAKERGFKCK